jgi:peptidoglycan/LPS O-acetylase OafA/YrhL
MEWKWAFLIGVTLGASWLSYHFLEKPYLNLTLCLAKHPMTHGLRSFGWVEDFTQSRATCSP